MLIKWQFCSAKEFYSVNKITSEPWVASALPFVMTNLYYWD